MKKGANRIEKDVFDIFKADIEAFIGGGVYLNGTRPHNSDKEDCVITHLTGLGGDVQIGKVNINFFVPNINIGSQKNVKNIARIIEIENFMIALVQKKHNEYIFVMEQTINSIEQAQIGQYLVNIQLKYKRFSK